MTLSGSDLCTDFGSSQGRHLERERNRFGERSKEKPEARLREMSRKCLGEVGLRE